MSTANIALGVVAVIVVVEHAAIWSLFWKRGWKVSVAPAPKPSPQISAVLVAGEAPAGTAVPAAPNGAAAG